MFAFESLSFFRDIRHCFSAFAYDTHHCIFSISLRRTKSHVRVLSFFALLCIGFLDFSRALFCSPRFAIANMSPQRLA